MVIRQQSLNEGKTAEQTGWARGIDTKSHVFPNSRGDENVGCRAIRSSRFKRLSQEQSRTLTTRALEARLRDLVRHDWLMKDRESTFSHALQKSGLFSTSRGSSDAPPHANSTAPSLFVLGMSGTNQSPANQYHKNHSV